ncbi:MAG: Bug family tripartite tricarboxylate transporter substrate binding protein [Burkholderiaceae bacterium]
MQDRSISRFALSIAAAGLVAVCAWAAPGGAQAQPQGAAEFPQRPVTLVVPYATGGPTDAMARAIAAALRQQLGQTVIVENRAGAGANLGAEHVARAAPDGYTIMLGTPAPLAINVSLFRKINYHPLRDFAPVIHIGSIPNVLAVHPKVPAGNLKELLAYAKANPGKLNFASSGNGATSHLAGVLFNRMAGTDLQHVPYKGTGPAMIDLLGGQVDMTFTDVLTALPHLRAGKLKAIGMASATRSQVLPDVPTLAEQGLSGYDSSVFFGVVAPARTPEPVLMKLNQAMRGALDDAVVSKLLLDQGLQRARDTAPQAFSAFLKTEVDKWAEVVKSSGAQVD